MSFNLCSQSPVSSGDFSWDSTLADSSKIRSSVGIAIDLFTPVGPMSFSLAETITQEDSDISESFRFSIGTTF